MSTLEDYLSNQLAQRAWSQRELARRAGISSAQVSNVITQQSNPGADFCIAIARALGESPEHILRLAGILPPLPPPVAQEHEALALFRRLDDRLRAAIIATMRNLLGIRTVATLHEQSEPYTVTDHVARILARDLQTLDADDQKQVFDLMRQLRSQHPGAFDETA